MPPHRDLTGSTFGRLRVVQRAEIRNGCSWWHCQCECGTQTTVPIGSLQSGRTKSCGCLQDSQRSRMGQANKTHGKTKTAEYRIWAHMKQRCHNPKDEAFIDYGGRGITVCPRWFDSFENFLADMGHRPSAEHSIDRIDSDGLYAPDNCRWATFSEQNKNRSFNRKLTRRRNVAT
jgi:hypothetical protein